MIQKIKELTDKYHQETVDIRRHIHANPELSFNEYETSKFVQQKLTEMGIPFQNGVADTGVVGLIEGKNPTKKVVALRADMDALPITEANDVPYKSKNEGVMHACGHDAHTSSLLGASRILNELKGDFEGTIKLIFQPAEERHPGGASIMIKEGVLENPKPNSIIGQHVHPLIPVGTVGFCPGLSMASTDEIEISIKGKGGHGALPQNCIDPVLIAAQVVVALQQVPSRFINPIVPSVLTFGSIESIGGTYNVIPNEVRIYGTFRMMNEEWRFKAHEHIRQIVTHTAQAYGGEGHTKIKVGYPFLINDEELTLRCRTAAEEYLGKKNVLDIPMRMTAEDFAYFSQNATGCFYRLGVANEARGITSQVHTPTFDIDEASLKVGVGLMAWLTVKELDI